jgi:hypothetical protein
MQIWVANAHATRHHDTFSQLLYKVWAHRLLKIAVVDLDELEVVALDHVNDVLASPILNPFLSTRHAIKFMACNNKFQRSAPPVFVSSPIARRSSGQKLIPTLA